MPRNWSAFVWLLFFPQLVWSKDLLKCVELPANPGTFLDQPYKFSPAPAPPLSSVVTPEKLPSLSTWWDVRGHWIGLMLRQKANGPVGFVFGKVMQTPRYRVLDHALIGSFQGPLVLQDGQGREVPIDLSEYDSFDVRVRLHDTTDLNQFRRRVEPFAGALNNIDVFHDEKLLQQQIGKWVLVERDPAQSHFVSGNREAAEQETPIFGSFFDVGILLQVPPEELLFGGGYGRKGRFVLSRGTHGRLEIPGTAVRSIRPL